MPPATARTGERLKNTYIHAIHIHTHTHTIHMYVVCERLPVGSVVRLDDRAAAGQCGPMRRMRHVKVYSGPRRRRRRRLANIFQMLHIFVADYGTNTHTHTHTGKEGAASVTKGGSLGEAAGREQDVRTVAQTSRKHGQTNG